MKPSKEPKKVVWLDDYDGGKYPACPECKEPAYYDDKCCFCGQVFEQDEAAEEFYRFHTTQIEKDGYTVVQAPNCHVQVYDPDGRLVSHASCTSKMTEAELEEHLELILSLRGRWNKNG